MACFLTETQKTLLDQTVALNDQYLTTMCRRSRNAFKARHREFRRRVKKGLETLLVAVEILVDPQQPRTTMLDVLDRQIDRDALPAARDDCREFQRLESEATSRLGPRYAYLRRYLPSFFDLPFQGETGAGPLLEGLSLAQPPEPRGTERTPPGGPDRVHPGGLAYGREAGGWGARPPPSGRSLWRWRSATRSVSGDLYLPESRRHVSFWNLLTEEHQ